MDELREVEHGRGAPISIRDKANSGHFPTGKAGSLRPSHQRILDAFVTFGAMTPDELAEKIARSVFYTRPRCSELRAMGLLRPNGEVHRNAASGLRAEVLTL